MKSNTISSLKPYPDNPRIHGDGAAIKKSIEELGDLSGVVFNIRNGSLVGGHYRTKTIPKESTIESHPVTDPTGTTAEGTIILPGGQRLNYREVDWPEDKHKLACVEANNHKIQGEWDLGLLEPLLADLDTDIPDFDEYGLDLLATEFDFKFDEEIENENDSDKIPPEPENIVIKKGDLIELGEHRVLCGDSTDKKQVEKLMNGEKADMVFTDPPYGVTALGGRRQTHNKKNISLIKNDDLRGDTLVEFLCLSLSNIPIKSGAGCYICYGWKSQKEFTLAIEKIKWTPRATITWVKNVFGLSAKNNFGYRPQTEFVYFATVTDKYEFSWFGGGTQSDVWNIARPTERPGNHPTPKPVELVQKALGNSSKSDDIISDTFLGSGSTLIACEKTNRKCYGMELDEKYCQVIIQRWADYTEKDQIKINGKEVSWAEYKET